MNIFINIFSFFLFLFFFACQSTKLRDDLKFRDIFADTYFDPQLKKIKDKSLASVDLLTVWPSIQQHYRFKQPLFSSNLLINVLQICVGNTSS